MDYKAVCFVSYSKILSWRLELLWVSLYILRHGNETWNFTTTTKPIALYSNVCSAL